MPKSKPFAGSQSAFILKGKYSRTLVTMDTPNTLEGADERAPLLNRANVPQDHTLNLTATPNNDLGSKSTLWMPLKKIQDVFQKMTWNLFLIWMLTSITNIMFGYASTSFSGLQSIPSFTQEFGTPNGTDGSYSLSASKVSFMSSIGLAGKLFGTLVRPQLLLSVRDTAPR